MFCTSEPKPRSGTWNRTFDDLKRKGTGGALEAVYATTLLRSGVSQRWWVGGCSGKGGIPGVGYVALTSLDMDLVDLAVSCQCE